MFSKKLVSDSSIYVVCTTSAQVKKLTTWAEGMCGFDRSTFETVWGDTLPVAINVAAGQWNHVTLVKNTMAYKDTLNSMANGFDYLDPVWWLDTKGTQQIGLYCGMANTHKDPYLVYYNGSSKIHQVSELAPIGVPPGYTVGEMVRPDSDIGVLEVVPLLGIVGNMYVVVNHANINEYRSGERYYITKWSKIERAAKPAEKSRDEIASQISRWWNDRVRSGLNPAFISPENHIGFAVPMTCVDFKDLMWCGSYTARDGDTWFTTGDLLAQPDAVNGIH